MSCGDLINLQSSVIPAGANTVLLSCCSIGNRNFLYVTDQNQDPVIVNNLYAFEINNDGSLSALPGFPIVTGSQSIGVVCCRVADSTFLYVASLNSNIISAFRINADGSLTTIADFPSITPTVLRCCNIGGVNYLYSTNVDNYTANTITVFVINNDGSLTEIPGSPFANQVGTIAPIGFSCCAVGDRNFLYIANLASNNLSGFSINNDGSLTELNGFPLTVGLSPTLAGCCTIGSATFLYVTASGDNNVSGFRVNADGSLAAVPGSPFTTGTFPQDVHCCTVGDQQILYITNRDTNNISAFTVAADGSLTELTNSPFAEPGVGPAGFVCCNVGDNQFFYVANQLGGGLAALKVVIPPVIGPTSLPEGVIRESYSEQLTQVSGTPPILWTITAGSLPLGLTLNSTTGEISGTPRRSGAFTFTVTATDVNNCSGSQEYDLRILTAEISLTKSATPLTFSKGGQIIIYTYEITNIGEAPLTIESLVDSLIGTVSCGSTIQPGTSDTCVAEYRVTSEDIALGRITNTATVTTTNGASATTTLQIFKKVVNETEVILTDHVYDWLITSDTRKVTIDLRDE